MNKVIADICKLLIPSEFTPVITENIIQVRCEVNCNSILYPNQSDLDILLALINTRDNIHISIIADDDSINFISNDDIDFDQYVEEYRTLLEDKAEFQIIITIEKKQANKRYSIYQIDKFLDYFTTLSVLGQLSKINDILGVEDSFSFEIQDDVFQEFNTPLIKFIPRNKELIINEQRNLSSRNKVQNLCHCSLLSKYSFVPNDFYCNSTDNTALNNIFNRLNLIYSIVYLFDIVEIDNNKINYKLNGYRSINQVIDIKDIDIISSSDYFEIYKWVYEGGNIVDKMGLTRNLLSLNFTPNSLHISNTTFDAIRSSFNLYQKENIKQYIEIRNKISEQLLSLQEKAEKIVESYVSDYKKSFLAVVSFYISVIVIRVVSKGDFSGGFTFEVSLLSIGFLFIFLLLMFYSRWEIKTQIERYKNAYQNMKTRYSDLLEASDIKRILNNDNDHLLNLEYINEKKKKYTELWIISLIVLFLITVTLFLFNKQIFISFPISSITAKLILTIKILLNAL